MSLIDILSVVFRHKKKVISVFVAISLGAIYYASSVPDTYTSEARLMMRGVRGSLSFDPSREGGVAGEYRPADRERTSNELAILQSRHLAESVVDEVGPAQILMAPRTGFAIAATIDGVDPLQEMTGDDLRNGAVKAVTQGLTAHSDGQIIWLTYTGQDPDTTHAVLDSLVAKYMDRHLEIFSSPASPEFFKKEADEVFQKLTVKQSELDAKRKEFDLGDVQAQKLASFTRQGEIQAQLSAARVQIRAGEASVKKLQDMMEARAQNVEVQRKLETNETVRNLRDQLLNLQMEEQELAMKYLDNDRELMSVRANIKLVQDRLNSEPDERTEVTTEVDATRQMIEEQLTRELAQLDAAKASEMALTEELDSVNQRIDFLVAHEPEFNSLQREVALLQKSYDEFLDSEQRAATSAAMDESKLSNITLVQAATKPFEADEAQRLRNVFLGIFFAAFAGIAIAFVCEQLDDSMKTSGEVEKKLDLPVLATVAYDKAI